jgi:hypothetical protein
VLLLLFFMIAAIVVRVFFLGLFLCDSVCFTSSLGTYPL